MNELPPPVPPTPPVQQDHFFRNLFVVVLLAGVAWLGYGMYQSVQDTHEFDQKLQEDFGRALRGD